MTSKIIKGISLWQLCDPWLSDLEALCDGGAYFIVSLTSGENTLLQMQWRLSIICNISYIYMYVCVSFVGNWRCHVGWKCHINFYVWVGVWVSAWYISTHTTHIWLNLKYLKLSIYFSSQQTDICSWLKYQFSFHIWYVTILAIC